MWFGVCGSPPRKTRANLYKKNLTKIKWECRHIGTYKGFGTKMDSFFTFLYQAFIFVYVFCLKKKLIFLKNFSRKHKKSPKNALFGAENWGGFLSILRVFYLNFDGFGSNPFFIVNHVSINLCCCDITMSEHFGNGINVVSVCN